MFPPLLGSLLSHLPLQQNDIFNQIFYTIIQVFYIYIKIYLFLRVFSINVQMCTECMPGSWGKEKMVLDFLETRVSD